MTVEQLKIVDMIGIDARTGEVILTICDHLSWSGCLEHLETLQEKINRYLAFVESGEMLAGYPDGADRPIVIKVDFKYKPNHSGRKFLHDAGQIIESAGFTLRYEVFAESWDN